MEKLSLLLEKNDENAIKLINYPATRQSTGDACGIVCTQTMLEYYGENHREDELVKYVRADQVTMSDDKNDANAEKIIKFFEEEKGFKVDAREMTINDLISYIDRDIPVIVMIQAYGDMEDYSSEWRSGHYVVAIGYTRNKMLFEDPSSFQVGYIPMREFLSRWHDQDEDRRYINYGIAVYGKPPKFDKNKWTRID